MGRWVHVATWCVALVFGSPPQLPSTSPFVVNASVFLPFDGFHVVSSPRVKLVLEMALEKVKPLLPGREMFFRFYDAGCQSNSTLKTAFEIFDPMQPQKCHVLFGPTCEYSTAQVGRLLKFFDVPLLTTGAMTWDFKNNKTRRDDEFFGLVRVGPVDFLTVAFFINAISAKYGWTKMMLLFARDGQKRVSGEATCKLMMETLVESFKKSPTKIEYRARDLESLNDTRKILVEEVGVDIAETYSDWQQFEETSQNSQHQDANICQFAEQF